MQNWIKTKIKRINYIEKAILIQAINKTTRCKINSKRHSKK